MLLREEHIMSKAMKKPAIRKSTGLPQARVETIIRKGTSAQDRVIASTSVLSFANIAPYQEKKGEAYMSQGQLDHFRNILETWRNHLIENAESTIKNMQSEQKVHSDLMDSAAQLEEFESQLQSRNRDRILLKKIGYALKKIDDKSYGYCEKTGDPVGLKRLEARPIAIYSLAAQEKHERTKQFFAQKDSNA
jgi:DnaK suppressor protein